VVFEESMEGDADTLAVGDDAEAIQSGGEAEGGCGGGVIDVGGEDAEDEGGEDSEGQLECGVGEQEGEGAVAAVGVFAKEYGLGERVDGEILKHSDVVERLDLLNEALGDDS